MPQIGIIITDHQPVFQIMVLVRGSTTSDMDLGALLQLPDHIHNTLPQSNIKNDGGRVWATSHSNLKLQLCRCWDHQFTITQKIKIPDGRTFIDVRFSHVLSFELSAKLNIDCKNGVAGMSQTQQTTVNIKSLYMYQQCFVIFRILQRVCDCHIFITLFRILQYICRDVTFRQNVEQQKGLAYLSVGG